MGEASQDIVMIHCNSCGQETKHELVHRHLIKHDVETYYAELGTAVTGEIWSAVRHELYECRGCEEVTFRRSELFSETLPDCVMTFHPPRVSRKLPDWLHDIDDKDTKQLLEEVYAALHADSRRLAMMGCRAILDRVLVRAVGDVGGFEEKLRRMAKERLLSETHQGILSAAIDAGSASAHRGYSPDPTVLEHVVAIVEHVVFAGVLSNRADGVRRETPARKRGEP